MSLNEAILQKPSMTLSGGIMYAHRIYALKVLINVFLLFLLLTWNTICILKSLCKYKTFSLLELETYYKNGKTNKLESVLVI